MAFKRTAKNERKRRSATSIRGRTAQTRTKKAERQYLAEPKPHSIRRGIALIASDSAQKQRLAACSSLGFERVAFFAGAYAPSAGAIDAACASAARNKLFHQRQEKRLAEPSQRTVGREVEGLADDVLIIFVEDDPKTKVLIETSAALFRLRNLAAKRSDVGWLLVIGKSKSISAPSDAGRRTPTATGRGFRPSVSPRTDSRAQRYG